MEGFVVSGSNNTAEISGSFNVSGSSNFNGSINATGGITGSLMASNGVVSSSIQIQNYNIFATTGSNTFSGGQTIQTGYVILSQVSQSLNFSDDVSAAAGGVPLGGLYRNGNFIAIRIS
jgi:hypothetical protein